MSSESTAATVVTAIVSIPVQAYVRGYTIMSLWGWFVVPLGVSAIGVWQGCGIAVFINLLTFNAADMFACESEPERPPYWKRVVFSLFLCLVTLGFGAIYHYLMGF